MYLRQGPTDLESVFSGIGLPWCCRGLADKGMIPSQGQHHQGLTDMKCQWDWVLLWCRVVQIGILLAWEGASSISKLCTLANPASRYGAGSLEPVLGRRDCKEFILAIDR